MIVSFAVLNFNISVDPVVTFNIHPCQLCCFNFNISVDPVAAPVTLGVKELNCKKPEVAVG
jgi:hypothetical protein